MWMNVQLIMEDVISTQLVRIQRALGIAAAAHLVSLDRQYAHVSSLITIFHLDIILYF